MSAFPRAGREESDIRVLMIAFHFPPYLGSSGIQRTLKFTKYLPLYGCQPVVLTANKRAYTEVSSQFDDQIPHDMPVYRAMAFDAQRHMSWKGRYPDILSIPDRFSSWIVGGVPAGLAAIRRHRPKVLWSTYPVASAHMIAGILSRLTSIPWVADFRDPMTGKGGGTGDLKGRSLKWVEDYVVNHANKCILVTDQARLSYVERYPHVASERFSTIENGFDESDFSFVDSFKSTELASNFSDAITLLHTGSVYPDENPAHRGPGELFRALKSLRDSHFPNADRLRIRFRGSGLDDMLAKLAKEAGVLDQVEIFPGIAYKEALREMASSAGLILLQGKNFSRQIPAKLYEYLRTNRPVIGLCGHESATAQTMKLTKRPFLADLADSRDIENCLKDFLDAKAWEEIPTSIPEFVSARSRQSLSLELAHIFKHLAASSTGKDS